MLELKEKYSEKEAISLFEENWDKVVEKIEKKLKNKAQIFDETSLKISKLYRSQIKDFGNREDDLLLLRSYTN